MEDFDVLIDVFVQSREEALDEIHRRRAASES
jgi:hypothetical protein